MTLAKVLWGSSAKPIYLFATAAILLFVALGAAQLWGSEWRWAIITDRMLSSHDYLHPYRWDRAYYDKPLGSYWLMAIFAKLFGGLSEWVARLPSVLAALGTIWCTYRLGSRLLNRSTGLLAGWILATSIMFVFWGRVAAADMLNLAGTIAAVTWYFERKDYPGFSTYFVFFLILAVASWMKGLIAPVVAILVLIPDLLREQDWRRHLRASLLLAGVFGTAIYFVPFALSVLVGGEHYGASGLWMVFRENIVRYFDAFDHKEPFYVYFYYLPLYQFPWSVFLPFAVVGTVRRWQTMTPASRWVVWAVLLVFVFLTASTSRRSYYVLPILPFVALMVADWLMTVSASHPRLLRVSAWIPVFASAMLLLWFGVAVPYGNSIGGMRPLAREIRATAESIAPWPEWRMLLWSDTSRDAQFYIRAANFPPYAANADELKKFIAEHPRTIVLARAKDLDQLKDLLPQAIVVKERLRAPKRFIDKKKRRDLHVALILPSKEGAKAPGFALVALPQQMEPLLR
jgi:4-amino-4-deoxy-L-arabinose transferase-like glycosyltransferase